MNKIQVKFLRRISTIEKRLVALSGTRRTNTYKRQREEIQRNKEASALQIEKQTLEFLAEEAGVRELTVVEKGLASGAFFQELRSFLRRVQDARSSERNVRVDFPTWEETATQFKKHGINNTAELHSACFGLKDLIDIATVPENPQIQRMKELSFKARLQQGGDIQFTPLGLVNQLISLAGLTETSRVLEPEAGIAYIADEVRKITPYVDCMEINYDFSELLKLKGYSLVGRDFLEADAAPVYDAVIMNPPFSDECRHIRHAYEFLKAGGILVSVCHARMSAPKGRKYTEFYEWLAGVSYHFRQAVDKFEATGTHPQILVIYK